MKKTKVNVLIVELEGLIKNLTSFSVKKEELQEFEESKQELLKKIYDVRAELGIWDNFKP